MVRTYICPCDGEEYFIIRSELEYPEPKRARRIRDKQRMKAKARRVFADRISHESFKSHRAYSDWMKANERLADHLAHCQKPCCNRARLHEGPTMQERRFMAAQRADGNI